jgi:hypothetical protein
MAAVSVEQLHAGVLNEPGGLERVGAVAARSGHHVMDLLPELVGAVWRLGELTGPAGARTVEDELDLVTRLLAFAGGGDHGIDDPGEVFVGCDVGQPS